MRRTLIWRVLCLYGLLLLGCVGMISWNARADREVSVIESREEASAGPMFPCLSASNSRMPILGRGSSMKRRACSVSMNYAGNS